MDQTWSRLNIVSKNQIFPPIPQPIDESKKGTFPFKPAFHRKWGHPIFCQASGSLQGSGHIF